MCSRYSMTSPPEAVRRLFKYAETPTFPPRFNIAPTQPVAIVRIDHDGARAFALVRWGLIPSWAKDPASFSTLINARSETAAEKPSFRASLRHRRCLVPADAFYEWTGEKGARQPHLIRRRDGDMLAFAGIWESWLGSDGSEFESMAILTAPANEQMKPIHDRMPLILEPSHFETWLDCRSGSSEPVRASLEARTAPELEIFPVSQELNNPRNERPSVQDPVEQPPG